MIGRSISHYRITEKLGEGGMGVVYKAEDAKLERPVALKFLPAHLLGNDDVRKRFEREAKAAAALHHPNICPVYEIDEVSGKSFISMAFIEGESLDKKIARGPLKIEEVLDIAQQIARGIEAAHEKGIFHRDIKPENIIVDSKGHTTIMDFGLAQLTQASRLTRADETMGTVAYMSPEQTEGSGTDHRTDIWSLGVVLYEMVSGQQPFRGDYDKAVMYSILNEEPKPLRKVRVDAPEDLEEIVRRALAKDREARYGSASEMAVELEARRASLSAPSRREVDLNWLWRTARRPTVAAPALLILLAIAGVSVWWAQRNSQVRWAQQTALPEAHRLADQGDNAAAWALAVQAENHVPEAPQLLELWERISAPLSVETDPPGAEVYWKPYAEPESEWQHAGRSPLQGYQIPAGAVRLRVVKEGFVPAEAVGRGRFRLRFTLDREGEAPKGTVRVTGEEFVGNFQAIGPLGPVNLRDYWIDKYEVTNREFKEFVDAGGYRERKYWTPPFLKDGRALSWERAMEEFRDATGRPGPAAWEAGGYPSGEADLPVTGVSWYEAAAYAAFAGKDLPTVYHWLHAAAVGRAPVTVVPRVLPFSNFGGIGLSYVGSLPGLGRYGTYDMAGNAREWCWNETEGRRYALGGSWADPTYRASSGDALPPFDRSGANGFRCVQYIEADDPPEALAGPIERRFRDYSQEEPVSDEVFDVYKALYRYDDTELSATVEDVDTSSDLWRREKVTFNAAYGDERIISHLFLPKTAPGPYQTVIYFQGSGALQLGSSDTLYSHARLLVDFIVQSGRAFVYPVYKGMHERQLENSPKEPTAWRDLRIQWSNDLGRTIDYLETRQDIDRRKLAYHGFSLGGAMGSTLLAVEDRLVAAVLEAGGLPSSRPLPEADPLNFLPRIRIPVLMLNGRYDTTFPVEPSQVPMFRVLGTPDRDKQHVILEGSHALLFTARNDVIRETLDWLDRYLGPAR